MKEVDDQQEFWDQEHPDTESTYTLVEYVFDPPRGYNLRAILEFGEKLKSIAVKQKVTLEEFGEWFHWKTQQDRRGKEDRKSIHPRHRRK